MGSDQMSYRAPLRHKTLWRRRAPRHLLRSTERMHWLLTRLFLLKNPSGNFNGCRNERWTTFWGLDLIFIALKGRRQNYDFNSQTHKTKLQLLMLTWLYCVIWTLCWGHYEITDVLYCNVRRGSRSDSKGLWACYVSFSFPVFCVI